MTDESIIKSIVSCSSGLLHVVFEQQVLDKARCIMGSQKSHFERRFKVKVSCIKIKVTNTKNSFVGCDVVFLTMKIVFIYQFGLLPAGLCFVFNSCCF